MTRSLRIAVLAHSTNPRGGVVHAMNLCEALVGLGYEAVLHAPDTGKGFFRASACETVSVPAATASSDTFAMVEQRIADYVAWFRRSENRGFDLYHAHDGISGNALASLKRERLISSFVRTVHHIDAYQDIRLARLEERSLRQADARMVVSAAWRRRLVEDYGLDAEIGGNGVDAERFHIARKPEAQLRARLQLGPGPIFLSVGGIEARKNTLRILEAFREVHAARPDARLVIAGGASLLDHSAIQAEFAARLVGMDEGAVVRLGPVADDEIPKLYRLATALVFASVKEGFGLCALEALASGIPAIVSGMEPFTEYLSESDALWCDPYNPHSIAHAMRVALDPGAAQRWRECGPAVAARFDWRAVACRHQPTYRRLLEPAHA